MRTGRMLAVQAAVLAVSAIVTAYAMLRAAVWNVDIGTIIFILWALSPYAAFFAASRLLVKFAPAANIGIAGILISFLMLAFTSWAYLGTMDDPSSTATLIFVFIPLYLYVGSFFLLSLVLLLSRFFKRNA